MTAQLFDFLSTVAPFDLLPADYLHKTLQNMSKRHYHRESVLFVQNRTELDHIYIVWAGKLEQYEQEGDQKTLLGFLEEKDIYGGMSILFNKGFSIRTIRALEDVTLYCLPKEDFLEICSQYPEFTAFFTEQFSQKMLQKSYVASIAQKAHTESTVNPGFLNLTLQDIFSREFASCREDASIQDVALLMTKKKRSSAVITNRENKSIGLLTDNDLRRKVVARAYPVQNPVRDIVSGPLITLPVQSQIFEAILIMMQHNIKHLAVTDDSQNVLGIATEQDLLLAQGRSPIYLIREIQLADNVQEIKARQRQLPGLIKSLLDSGAKASHINRIITEISDAILRKIIDLALLESGQPPVEFAFMIMGSEGRKEQTLKTDQDNAIIYQDVPQDKEQEVQAYFLKLGEKICAWLDAAGYTYCEYEIMAQNPKWCQPLHQWKEYFREWVLVAEPESLLHASIFFDFRCGYGQEQIIQELREYLFQTLSDWAGFYRHLADNALHFKPPLDFFGNLILQNKDGRKNLFNIKSPMRLIVDFARIYALKNRIENTNTMNRLYQVQLHGDLENEDYEELTQAYELMMHLRLAHQVDRLVEKNEAADNLILPKCLTHIDRQALKEACKRIRIAQNKMRMELTQGMGFF